MFTVKVVTSDGEKEFTAKSFFQMIVEGGRIKVRWETEGEDETVTYSRIRTIVEKKVNYE